MLFWGVRPVPYKSDYEDICQFLINLNDNLAQDIGIEGEVIVTTVLFNVGFKTILFVLL